MNKINETIVLNGNEGLEIDISRIVYNDGAENAATESRPTWMTSHFTAAQLAEKLGSLTFTEDELEGYLKAWLEYTLNCGVKTFRWMWDKYRDYKAA